MNTWGWGWLGTAVGWLAAHGQVAAHATRAQHRGTRQHAKRVGSRGAQLHTGITANKRCATTTARKHRCPPTCAGSHSRFSAACPSTSTHLSYSTCRGGGGGDRRNTDRCIKRLQQEHPPICLKQCRCRQTGRQCSPHTHRGELAGLADLVAARRLPALAVTGQVKATGVAGHLRLEG